MKQEGQQYLLEGSLRPQDTKTFHCIPLQVGDNCTSIRIRFSYGPREETDFETGRQIVLDKLAVYRRLLERLGEDALLELEKRQEAIVKSVLPLRNLLNFCLYDPNGKFRGRWDSPQYFDQWVEIGSDDTTSRGFLPGALPSGEWIVEVEIHAVVTAECRYTLAYELTDRNEAVDDGSLSLKVRDSVGIASTTPARTGPGWYRGELHLHTNHSDGNASLSEMVAAAKKHGLDFVVLSDHNTVSSHKDISGAGFPVIPGMELTTFHGHAVALGVGEFVDWREERDSDLHKQLDFVHYRGGLFSVAHPFVIGGPICTGCEWEYHNIDWSRVDLIEVWSGSWRKGWAHNALALAWWDDLLNKGLRIVGVAARDVHDPAQMFIPDTADTYVWAEATTRGALLKGLKAGRVFVSSGPKLDFTIQAGSVCYGLGDTVNLEGCSRLLLKIALIHIDEPAILRVIGNGSLLKEYPVEQEATFECEIDTTINQLDWVRVELFTRESNVPAGRTMLAFTNPIYIGIS